MGKSSVISGLLIFILLLFPINIAHSLQPPTTEQIAEYKRDGSWPQRLQDALSIGNHTIDKDLALRTRKKLQNLYNISQGLSAGEIEQIQTPPPRWRGMPTTGNVKMFVLCISFNDYPAILPTDSIANMQQVIFGPEDKTSSKYPYESLSAYYDRSSHGLLNLNGLTLGWYNPGTDRSAVSETTTGRENLIKEAIDHFDVESGVDFSQFDNDGDGDIDYFAVIWTGPHGAWASFWWGYQTRFNDRSYRVDGKTLGKYSWQWESYNYPAGSFSPKVLIHETGHALGLPDYYDYDSSVGPDGGVGKLDMMDGNWGDHNCFSKFTLDWLTPTVISLPGSYPGQTLRASTDFNDCLLIMPDATGSAFEEFFLVQHRQREENDKTIPTDGLLIWHVNSELNGSNYDYAFNNSYTQFKLLRLMEADGLEEIETNSATADAGDFYTTGEAFTPDTIPNSDAYFGNQTGIEITAINSSATASTFDLYLAGETGDSYEPDNSSTETTPLFHGSSQTHSIYPAADEDWYSFTLDSTSDITITTSGLSGDTRLWLYNSEVNLIDYDDNSGEGSFSQLDKINVAPGNYFIKIDEFGNDDVISSYTIELQITEVVLSPDLTVIEPDVSNSNLIAGQAFTLYAKARNQGNTSSAETTLRWYRSADATISTSDTSLGTEIVSTLDSGETADMNLAAIAPDSGIYWVGACIDVVSGESNTTNQCSAGVQITVSTTVAPDLVVTNPGVNDATLIPGQSFSLYATAHNQGTDSSAGTTLRWYRSVDATISATDTSLGTGAVPILSPGETLAMNQPSTAPSAGIYWIGACIDAVSGESNTTNQCSSGVQITVNTATAPDLVVKNPGVSDSDLTPEKPFMLYASAHNQGIATSAGTTLRWYRSADPNITTTDTLLGIATVSPLSSGETLALNIPATAPKEGIYWVGACIDAVKSESNITNQCSPGVQITVSPADNPDAFPWELYAPLFLKKSAEEKSSPE